MYRTWDSPELYLSGDAEPVEACPTLSAAIANYAIRGALSPLPPAAAGEAGQYPSFEETADFLDQTISERFTDDQGEQFANVFEDDVRVALDQRVSILNRFTIGFAEPFVVNNNEPLEANRERFTERLSDLMMEPDTRRQLMDNVDDYIRAKSDALTRRIRSQSLEYDVIIKGGGMHAASVVAALQECIPEIRTLIIDDGESTDRDGRPRLGGQFRYYGDIPVFDLNSGTGELLDIGDVYGLPRKGGNLNSFGLHSPIQLPHFVATDLPTNIDPGEASALIIALSGADVIFGNVAKQDQDGAGRNLVTLADGNNRPFRPFVTPEPVIEATGIGRPKDVDEGLSSIMGIDTLWREIGMHRPGQPHPLERFAGKVVLGGGCGDSMKALFKLLLGQGPEAVYCGMRASRGRLKVGHWVAPDFEELGVTKQGYKSGVRPIYASLSRFFPLDENDMGSRLRPYIGRLEYSDQAWNIMRPDGTMQAAPIADVVLRGIGVSRPKYTEPFRDRLVAFGQAERDMFGSAFALRSAGSPGERHAESLGIGPVSPLDVNDDAGVPANTVSVWSRAPADALTTYWLANRIRARKRRFALAS